jgi:hypothetical protein
VIGVGLAVLAGLGTGLTLSGKATGSPAAPTAPCPGARDDAGRRAAAVCLVSSYYALENVTPDVRSAKLAGLVLSSALDATRGSYKVLDPKVATEYAAVAATNLSAGQSGDDVTGQAWVAFVDSYRDSSPPLAQWWITGFTMRWQGGQWWLAGGVTTEVDATPPSSGAAPRNGFGPGWVAAGRD